MSHASCIGRGLFTASATWEAPIGAAAVQTWQCYEFSHPRLTQRNPVVKPTANPAPLAICS